MSEAHDVIVEGCYVIEKLANMRKTQRFSVSPMSDSRVLVQSDKSISAFDFRTHEGTLSTNGCYFHHLAFAKP